MGETGIINIVHYCTQTLCIIALKNKMPSQLIQKLQMPIAPITGSSPVVVDNTWSLETRLTMQLYREFMPGKLHDSFV